MSEQEYSFEVFPKRDITIVKGKNATLWDDKGNTYIDCVAGIGVATVGHCNADVATAIAQQAKKLITCPGIFYNDVRAQTLQKLVEITPASVTQGFLCNSGTEAVEAAFKFARYTTGKTDIVAMMRGFHGRTMGALSATFKKSYREPFEPLVPGCSFVPYNNLEKFEAALTEKTAAVIVELVQGEGGVRLCDATYIQAVQQLCKERNILLIVDEIQTGFCRTGKMFACEHYAIQPDMLCLAKAIAGGAPMGAVMCADTVNAPLGKHGTTFGGNPLTCAAALATITYMQQHDLATQAEEKGAYFEELFTQHTLGNVREFRRLGFMIGIELKEKVQPHVEELMREGVLCLPAGSTVLRFLPPITISKEEIKIVVEKLVRVLS